MKDVLDIYVVEDTPFKEMDIPCHSRRCLWRIICFGGLPEGNITIQPLFNQIIFFFENGFMVKQQMN